MDNVTVIYHKNCNDGFCAAWLFYHSSIAIYSSIAINDITYVACAYGDPVPDIDVTSNVYIVDFSFSEEELRQLATKVGKLVVLDHHSTASHVGKLIDEGVISGIYDNSRSGAKLTLDWLIFDKKSVFGENIVNLVNYIQDADLYKFELPHSRDVNAALRSLEWDFDTWERISSIADTLTLQGSAINRYRSRVLQEHVDNATISTFYHRDTNGVMTEYSVWFVECSTKEIISDLGNMLCKLPIGDSTCGITNSNLADFALILQRKPNGVLSYSLRSIGDLHVGNIAKTFGGGGHKNAAGYVINVADSRKAFGHLIQ